MTKEIPLTQGQVALIDDEDFDLVSQYKWHAGFSKGVQGFYALTSIYRPNKNPRVLGMHRLITGLDFGNRLHVDHLNHNTLDNRRENLRIVAPQENSRNKRKHSNNTSGYVGVSWNAQNKKWRARIHINNHLVHLGYYDSKHDAAKERNMVAAKNGYLVLNEIKE